MADTEHPPPSGGGGSNGGNPPRDFSSTHRVKKLLETYRSTAGRTLTGPASMEEAPYQRGRSMAYKLPPDVELSKTVEDDPPPPSPKRHQPEYGYHHAGRGEPPSEAMPQEGKVHNGRVTLSR